MKKFLVLYILSKEAMDEMMHNTTPEEREKSMGEWKEWMAAHVADFADMGAPLGKNTRVTKDGAREQSNEIGGYGIIQAASKEDAVKVISSSPHFGMVGSYVEVMECMQM